MMPTGKRSTTHRLPGILVIFHISPEKFPCRQGTNTVPLYRSQKNSCAIGYSNRASDRKSTTMIKRSVLPGCIATLFLSASLFAQDTVHYSGQTLVNVDYHHGQLRPAMGVHNIQTMRANRDNAANSWTYN